MRALMVDEVAGAGSTPAKSNAAAAQRRVACILLSPLVLDVHGSPDRLGIPLEFGGRLADLGVVFELAMLVGNDCDRERHDGEAVERAAPIARFDVALAQVLRVVEFADVAIEAVDDLPRHLLRARRQRDEDEIVAADVTDEILRRAAA